MEEKEKATLSLAEEKAIRRYVLSLASVPGVLAAILAFIFGFVVKDYAVKTAETDAQKVVQSQIFTAVNEINKESLSLVRQATATKTLLDQSIIDAKTKISEVEQLKGKLEELKTSVEITKQALSNSDNIADSIFNKLKDDPGFAKKVLSQSAQNITVSNECFRPRTLVRCYSGNSDHMTWVDNESECTGAGYSVEGRLLFLASCK